MSAILIAAAILAVPSVQSGVCKDDKGQDRCTEAAQSQMRDAMGMSPIADLARSGAIVRRVSYIDGYGNNLIGIEFVRAPASDPIVRVILPQRQGRDRQVMEAPIDPDRWATVITGSANADRAYIAASNADTVNICLHSWVMLFEAADQQNGRSGVRSRLSNGCGASPVAEFSMLAAKEAVAVFVPCDRLEPTNYRNDASLLAACFTLQGDRLAAAEFVNRTDGLGSLNGSAQKALKFANSYKLTVNWNGRTASGDAAQALILSQLPEDGRADITIREARGLTPSTGTATGMLHRRPSSLGKTVDEADVTLSWDLQWGQPVTAVTVGPWRTRNLP